MVAPVILGQGKRLFGDGTPPRRMQLIEHRLSRGGIAMATFEPGGPVTTGSFPMPDPSPLEQARRDAIARGEW